MLRGRGGPGQPVYVRPEWLVESVRARRRLPESQYLLLPARSTLRGFALAPRPATQPPVAPGGNTAT